MSKTAFGVTLIVLLAACEGEDTGDMPPDDFSPPPSTDTVGLEARNLEAELPLLLASTISHVDEAAEEQEAGTVRILRSSEPNGAMTVTIELNEVPPGSHAWEIRQGDCVASTDSTATSPTSRTAGVVGTVEVGDAGFGEASSMLPEGVFEAGDLGRSRYSLVVLEAQQAGNAPAVIACAEL